MGTLSYLIKIDRGEIFDLGKSLGTIFYDAIHGGSKPFLIEQVFDIPSNLQNLVHKEIQEGFYEEAWKKEPYCTLWSSKFANTIFEWSRYDRVILCSDTVWPETLEYAFEFYTEKDAILHLGYDPMRKDFREYKETGNRYFSV